MRPLRYLFPLVLAATAAITASIMIYTGFGRNVARQPDRLGVEDHSGAGPHLVRVSYRQGQPLSLRGGVDWINSGPITLAELRGKIVLLDFWTLCCINCHHVLPDLAKLEEKYKDELVVIGVHSAKFPAERETESIRNKVREYRIKHPVVNDAKQIIWNHFGVNSWPTLVLIDPRGHFVAAIPGEGTALDGPAPLSWQGPGGRGRQAAIHLRHRP
jgi:thiol-disulfide isomerase/thioredoxin